MVRCNDTISVLQWLASAVQSCHTARLQKLCCCSVEEEESVGRSPTDFVTTSWNKATQLRFMSASCAHGPLKCSRKNKHDHFDSISNTSNPLNPCRKQRETPYRFSYLIPRDPSPSTLHSWCKQSRGRQCRIRHGSVCVDSLRGDSVTV
jgi:hypothetical protein